MNGESTTSAALRCPRCACPALPAGAPPHCPVCAMVKHGTVFSAPTHYDRAFDADVWRRAALYAAEEVAKMSPRGGHEAAALLRAYVAEIDRRLRQPQWEVRVAGGEDAERAEAMLHSGHLARPITQSADGPGAAARLWLLWVIRDTLPPRPRKFAGPWRALVLSLDTGEVWLVKLHVTVTDDGAAEVDALGATDVQGDTAAPDQRAAVADMRRRVLAY